MLKEIGIRNYKCFSELNLELKCMNVLSGANAAGKSSVIQALLLASATMKEKENNIDINQALGVQIGNPQALVAQNPVEGYEGDFGFSVKEDDTVASFCYKIDKMSPLNLTYTKTGKQMESRVFYLNAERVGPRISYPAGGEEIIRPDGSNAAYVVDQADFKNLQVPLSVRSENSNKFSAQVEGWMNLILGDVQLRVSTELTKASTDIRYRNSMVDHDISPTMTGFGISYIFSIVSMALWCTMQKNTVLIVENPEAHLHPAAQSRIGKFLQIVSDTGVQVIIETHSEHVIDGIRVQAAAMNITDHVLIHFFHQNNRKIMVDRITVTESGELSDWPVGFFDQKTQDLRDLYLFRSRNADK